MSLQKDCTYWSLSKKDKIYRVSKIIADTVKNLEFIVTYNANSYAPKSLLKVLPDKGNVCYINYVLVFSLPLSKLSESYTN